jgi:hypothetical protein
MLSLETFPGYLWDPKALYDTTKPNDPHRPIRILTIPRCLPPNEPIDLVNVAFQRNPDLPTDGNKHHYKQKNKAGQGQGSATGSKGSKGTKGAGADCKKGKGVVNRSVMEANGTGAGTGNGAKSTTMAEVAGGAAESSGSISAEGGTASPSATIPASESEADTGSTSGSSPSAPVGSAVDRLASLSLTPPTNAASAVPRPKNDTQGRTEKLPNGLTQAEHARMVAEHEYNVPDRIAGYEAVQELRACCERREFRFVTVDVTYAVCPFARAVYRRGTTYYPIGAAATLLRGHSDRPVVEHEQCADGQEYMAHREQVMDVMYPCTTGMSLLPTTPP